MKLKINADKKDFIAFLIYIVFLFYVVALVVTNLNNLSLHGEFLGLNPFSSLHHPLLGITFLGTFGIILATLATTKDKFFKMEKGIGISFKKEDKKYSRWATEKEMKEHLLGVDAKDDNLSKSGVPLISKNNKLWVDDGESHSLVIGATGSGKSQCISIPTVKILAKARESMIITDPKGELYENTSGLLKAKGYDIVVLNFRDPLQGNCWNPLWLPYQLYIHDNKDKAQELLDDLAANILYEENDPDPFWNKTSADYFTAIALALFEDADPSQINLNSIGLTTTVGDEKIGGSRYDKEYFSLKDATSPAYINASGTILAPSDTKASVISVFKQKIKLFTSRENLSDMLKTSDFKISDIGRKPTAVFIIIQDEKKTYHALATIFIKQCYEILIDVAQANGGKLRNRTNFILDEFANMPPLRDVTTMITAARSRQIRFLMIIQNFAQLNQIYGEQNAETIKGNCTNIIYIMSTELKALEEISKLAGEEKSKKEEKTASTPLVTISDLQRMKKFDIIVLRMREQPFKTSFTPDFKIDWGKKYPAVPIKVREKAPIEVFDIREFVKNAKKEKIDALKKESDESTRFKPTYYMPKERSKNTMSQSEIESMASLINKINNNMRPAGQNIQYEEDKKPRKRYTQSLADDSENLFDTNKLPRISDNNIENTILNSEDSSRFKPREVTKEETISDKEIENEINAILRDYRNSKESNDNINIIDNTNINANNDNDIIDSGVNYFDDFFE